MTDIHSLLEQLEELRVYLNGKNKRMNPIEAYSYFIRASDKGKNCTYAVKAKHIFKKEMLEEVVEKIGNIQKLLDAHNE